MGSGLFEALSQAALAQGFAAVGGVDWKHPETQSIYAQHAERYTQWVARGAHGEMEYLARGLDRRRDPRLVFPDLQSALVVLAPYSAAPRPRGSRERGPEIARYLEGEDYHKRLKRELQAVLSAVAPAHPELRSKICIDTSAVLERTWAMLAGLGWIGKNTLLIHPQLGSFTFIGVVFLNQPLERGPTLLPDYCGNCTRCLEACPTGAFTAPHDLDSRRCISAWTLETRGDLPADASLVDAREDRAWIAGCDRCQEVCPFNTKAARATSPQPTWGPQTWEEHLAETEAQYAERVANSALKRVKHAQALRNLNLARRQTTEPPHSP